MSITEINVPNHMSNPTDLTPNPNPVGRCEIFIVSYWKDFPWLELCLKSIQKFCRGFSGVTVVFPKRDQREFPLKCMGGFYGPVPLRFKMYDEVEGKGMVQHMEIMARADEFVPHGTEYVLHHDSDGMFNVPTTPEDFFRHDKPVYLYRTWESLTDKTTKVVSNCAIWRAPTDEQLGFQSQIYAMCCNTQMMPVEFYRKYRQHLFARHGDLLSYFTSGQNAWPQDRMDFTAMGAFAWESMRDSFAWFDVENGTPHPPDRKKAYHSHSGFVRREGGEPCDIRAEIEKIIA